MTLAAVAIAPAPIWRAAAIAAGLATASAGGHVYRRRVTPFLAVLTTICAGTISVAALIVRSGLPWSTGISWSQAGALGQPGAWLFTTTALLAGVGVLTSGHVLVREGRRRGELSCGWYRAALTLPAVSFTGFLVVAVSPVGANPALSAVHNLASWAALGSIWLGMTAAVALHGISRSLRWFSAMSSLLVFVIWLPNGLRFMRLITARPISMLAMEITVFPLCFMWLGWLAWEWSQPIGPPAVSVGRPSERHATPRLSRRHIPHTMP